METKTKKRTKKVKIGTTIECVHTRPTQGQLEPWAKKDGIKKGQRYKIVDIYDEEYYVDGIAIRIEPCDGVPNLKVNYIHSIGNFKIV